MNFSLLFSFAVFLIQHQVYSEHFWRKHVFNYSRLRPNS